MVGQCTCLPYLTIWNWTKDNKGYQERSITLKKGSHVHRSKQTIDSGKKNSMKDPKEKLGAEKYEQIFKRSEIAQEQSVTVKPKQTQQQQPNPEITQYRKKNGREKKRQESWSPGTTRIVPIHVCKGDYRVTKGQKIYLNSQESPVWWKTIYTSNKLQNQAIYKELYLKTVKM